MPLAWRNWPEEECGSPTHPPHSGLKLGCAPPRPARGVPAAPLLETPPRPAARNGGTRGGRGKRGLRAGGRAQAGGRLAPGPEKGLPPGGPTSPAPGPRPTAGSRRAHRLHGGGHVVVALRLLGQPRPLQQLLAVPHVAEPGLASLPAPARSPARPRSPRRPPLRAYGLPAGRAAGSRQLARSLARPALCGLAAAGTPPRELTAAPRGMEDGRTPAQWERPGRAARSASWGRSSGPNGLFQGDVTFYK